MSDLIASHCEWLRAGKKSPRTYGAREEWLRRADRDLPFGLVEATQPDLTAWFNAPKLIGADREMGWSDATAEKAFYHLNAFFEWGVDPTHAVDPNVPVLDDNPMVGMLRPHAEQGEPRPVTDAELHYVLTEAREPHRTAALMAVTAGLRVSELSEQRREHIDEESVWVLGKGGRRALVPMQPELWEDLRDTRRGVIIEQRGGVRDGRRMSARFANYCARTLDMPGVSLHRFRHKYAQLLRRAGADLATISANMRHKHYSSTEIYFRPSETERRIAAQALRLPVPAPR